MHHKVIDLTGKTFGKLRVLNFVRTGRGRRAIWQSQCECGNTVERTSEALRRGKATGCGCGKTKHGHYQSPAYLAYLAYHNMLQRCLNPKAPNYHRYGGRGITVCERWRESFANFHSDVGDPPEPGLTLDRERNSGNYEPGNVRWATRKQQSRNISTNRLVEVSGAEMPLAEAVERFGQGPTYEQVAARLNKLGWTLERALSTPVTSRKGPRP